MEGPRPVFLKAIPICQDKLAAGKKQLVVRET